MPEVLYAERKSAVLTPSSLACLAHVPTVNLTAGCAYECRYCYARGYRTHPGEGKVRFYTNTLSKLREELHQQTEDADEQSIQSVERSFSTDSRSPRHDLRRVQVPV